MVDMENKIPPVAINLRGGRVEHYNDVIEFMITSEVAKCKEEGWVPSNEEIQSFRISLIRLMTIRGKMEDAMKMRIPKRKVFLAG